MVIMIKNILDLTDDCLYLIFRKLPVKDQLALIDICDRFQDIIVNMIWRTRYAELTTNDIDTKHLTANEYERFILLNSSNVRSVIITDTRSWSFTSYLGRFYRPELMFYFTCEFPNLNKLNCQDETLHDQHIRLLARKCPQLKALTFRSTHVTGEYLLLFKQLEILEMHEAAINEKYMYKLLERDLIKKLVLVHSPKTDLGAALAQMSEKTLIKNLHELHLAKDHLSDAFTDRLYMLPNLKVIQLCDWTEPLRVGSDGLLRNLDLRTRGLQIQQISPTQNIFLELTGLMHNVEELQLKCPSIYNSTAKFVANSLRMTRFYLYAELTKITDFVKLLDTLIAKLMKQKQTLQTPRPILTVYVIEPTKGFTKNYLDAINLVSPNQNVLKCEIIRKKDWNDSIECRHNYIAFRLR